MRTILTALFMTLATQVVAEGKLPDIFWVECSGKTLLGAERNILVKIDREKKVWEQKLPWVGSYQICADDVDVIRYRTKADDDCTDYTDYYFNKWSGDMVGLGEYTCQILKNAPKPKWSDASHSSPPVSSTKENEVNNSESAIDKIIYPRLRPQELNISDNTHDDPVTNLEDILNSFKDTPSVTTPPLTENEKSNFRSAVSDCWEYDDKTKHVSVTVAFELLPSGKVKTGSFELVSFTGYDRNLVNKAYRAAKRAIQKCELNGYALPKEKYAHWQWVEVNFDPN